MKKFLLSLGIFFTLCYSAFALEITIIGNDDGIYNDWYEFNTYKSNIFVLLTDKFSNDYRSGDRVDIIQQYDNANDGHDSYTTIGEGVLESELYGSFYLKDSSLKMKNDTTINLNCNNVSYSYFGSLYSPSFGDFEIKSGSYYCPLSGKSSLILESGLLGDITISGENIIDNTVVKNIRGEDREVSNNMVFDDKKISITGTYNLKKTSGLDSEYSDNNGIKLDSGVDGSMAVFNRNISKNLVKYTRGVSPETVSDYLDAFTHTKKVFYYNYEGKEAFDISNVENKGKILTLGDGATETDDISLVYGHQLLYVKGGNLYINTDISNENRNSQLVIIVKRDSTSEHKKNGGNIYINPNVTNIDAVLIADGSIISFDGYNVLNAEDDTNRLRKQLLIYGSISTKNTFGDDIAIYGTDDYIDNGGNQRDNIKTYNLAKLRSFQAMLNDNITSGDCEYWGDAEIVARGNTGDEASKYSFIGKKRCSLTDETYSGLRSSEKLSPLVIEYNPILQTNPHFMLQK